MLLAPPPPTKSSAKNGTDNLDVSPCCSCLDISGSTSIRPEKVREEVEVREVE